MRDLLNHIKAVMCFEGTLKGLRFGDEFDISEKENIGVIRNGETYRCVVGEGMEVEEEEESGGNGEGSIRREEEEEEEESSSSEEGEESN